MTPQKLGIGQMVWWSLPEQIGLTRTAWNDRFESFPMSQEPLGDPLRRALYAVEAPKGSKRLVRPLKEHNRWAVVIETPNHDDLDYRTDLTVELNTSSLFFTRAPLLSATANELKQRYQEELGRVTTGAVADMILRAVRGRCLAVGARKSGGVYFVPAERTEDLDAVEKVVDAIDGEMMRVSVVDEGATRQQIIRMIVKDLKGSVETVRANLDSRHKIDAALEAKDALDRLSFYHTALDLAAEQAGILEIELNDLLVKALTPPQKKGGNNGDTPQG